MATSIAFTDAVGAATLTNTWQSPGDRFKAWTPTTRPVQDVDTGLGTGATHAFVFRTDYGATFALAEIPMAALEVADRLVAHLLSGGTCAVATGDAAARSYPTCGLMPGTTPALRQTDGQLNVWELSLSLINRETVTPPAVPARMLCVY